MTESSSELQGELELTQKALQDVRSAFEHVLAKLKNSLGDLVLPNATWVEVVAAVEKMAQTNAELTTELATYRQIIALGSLELNARIHAQDVQKMWQRIEELEKRLPPLQEPSTKAPAVIERPRCHLCYYPLPASSAFCPNCGK